MSNRLDGKLQSVTGGFGGGNRFCALGEDLTVHCWGTGLGDTPTAPDERFQHLGIVQLSVSHGVGNEPSYAAGHICAVTAPGDVFCRGGNALGQVGDGSTTNNPRPCVS